MEGRDPAALDVLERSLEAHGGRALWESAASVTTTLDIGGAALALKGRSPFARRIVAEVDPLRPAVELRHPRGTFRMDGWSIRPASSGPDEAYEVDVHDGSHRAPRLWSDLDEAHFLSYAVWNYVLGPWLLLHACDAMERLPDGARRGQPHARVRVRFRPDVPTHCPEQTFWFDAEGRLARLDYTAHALSSWAHGAHEVESYATFDGIELPRKRRVRLRPFGGGRSAPLVSAMRGELRSVVFTAQDGSERRWGESVGPTPRR
ncbi:MAG: hypothetical protein AAFZ87_11070 [Planctomycetota bacterium]